MNYKNYALRFYIFVSASKRDTTAAPSTHCSFRVDTFKSSLLQRHRAQGHKIKCQPGTKSAGEAASPSPHHHPPSRRHHCHAIAIFQPELPAPFKGSSQDAHLMQREGRLKPRPDAALWSDCCSPSNRSQTVSLPFATPLCERCTGRLYSVAACGAPSRITPLHSWAPPLKEMRLSPMHKGLLCNKYIHAFMYI